VLHFGQGTLPDKAVAMVNETKALAGRPAWKQAAEA